MAITEASGDAESSETVYVATTERPGDTESSEMVYTAVTKSSGNTESLDTAPVAIREVSEENVAALIQVRCVQYKHTKWQLPSHGAQKQPDFRALNWGIRLLMPISAANPPHYTSVSNSLDLPL